MAHEHTHTRRPSPEGRGLQPPGFGQASPTPLEHADPSHARFLAVQTPHARTGGHGQDDDAAGTR
ncbi:hypothetical protein [Streptomyces sp. A0642]|uniref:hypothetical protein n=1 Tax=Streptomyces sp. A0642 TaxID=2563100 RepID=UPI001F1160A2|nr:hypothetical protein [Streptomyces sp. A0642]